MLYSSKEKEKLFTVQAGSNNILYLFHLFLAVNKLFVDLENTDNPNWNGKIHKNL